MPKRPNPYREHLDPNAANYAVLTPTDFLHWAAEAYPRRTALIHGDIRQDWGQLQHVCQQVAAGLQKHDIGVGDTVAVMLPNTPAMIYAHFAVPMTGAVLNCINTRLDPATVAYILRHSESKLFFYDAEYDAVVLSALQQISEQANPVLPLCIRVLDPVYVEEKAALGQSLELSPLDEEAAEPSSKSLSIQQAIDGQSNMASNLQALTQARIEDFDRWLSKASAQAFLSSPPELETDAIGLNYTSGTTGHPKGVVVHHRGAYLNALSNVLAWSMPRHPVYLWTLPMFHCNGWCFPWTIAALAGVNVCLRKVDPALIFRLIREHRVSHYCGAPIVHAMLINAPASLRAGIDHRVACMVAGAAPPAAMIAGMEAMGFDLTHVYGLTEVYGPASVCAKQDDWAALSLEDRAERNARQGLRYPLQAGLDVMDPETMQAVPRDGEHMGEVMFRGNIVMKGYLKDPEATKKAFAGGWFHTGDLAVVDASGYVRLKDRAKDIIISGGENISSIEIEDALYRHPAVMACAVVAKPDPKWGETPLAFVELKPGFDLQAQALIDHCRGLLAGFKCPREVRFVDLPKTSTGKIQKHLLRAQAKSASAIA
ncbi:MAG: acyl-CoA synthetase [Betaproteobacteria bacterium]|nr:acyl-CoA synthetase [Betaproteobacteria bacterium]NDF50866.1 acyl-CoA synthetase [Betaproteobacteria bacterium]